MPEECSCFEEPSSSCKTFSGFEAASAMALASFRFVALEGPSRQIDCFSSPAVATIASAVRLALRRAVTRFSPWL